MSQLTPTLSNFTESEKDFKQDIAHVEHAQLDTLTEEGDAELTKYTDSSIVRAPSRATAHLRSSPHRPLSAGHR